RVVRRGQSAVQTLRLVSDGQQGAIALWTDLRSSGTIDDRLLRVGPAGDIAAGWTTNGVSDGATANVPASLAVADGSGGAYVVHVSLAVLRADRLGPDAQRVAGWPVGQVQIAPTTVASFRAAADAATGLFVAYAVAR